MSHTQAVKNELATMAAKYSTKPNKHDAQAAITSLYNALEGNAEAVATLAHLYKYFTPAMPKKPKSVFQWVAKAVGKKDVRYYLNYVYVTDDEIVATDGHRCHIAPNSEGIDPGYYFPTGEKCDEDVGRFPDYKRIIPQNQWLTEISIQPNELPVVQLNKKVHYVMVGDTAINSAYLFDALSYENDKSSINVLVHKDDSNAACKIELSGMRTVVLMPINLKHGR